MNLIWIITFYIFTGGGYFYFSHQPTNNHFVTSFDKYIPLIPVFVIPYFFAIIMFIAAPIFFYIKLGFKKTKPYLITQAVASAFSFIIYALYPTSVMREQITGNGFFENVLKILYSNDRPSAAFPSGHVFQSIIISYFLWKYFPKTRNYILIILPLIIASTVFLKQHYLPDIFGGIAVATIAIISTNHLLQGQSL